MRGLESESCVENGVRIIALMTVVLVADKLLINAMPDTLPRTLVD